MDTKEDTIYPIKNMDFNIENRFEFDIPVIKEIDTCDNKSFKLTSYQIFLKNFISNDTPYNSILLYYGTGTGKTCSAVNIAENFRDIYQKKEDRIIIISAKKIREGWYNNIYDPTKNNEQCTGDTYEQLSKDTAINRNTLVKKYYEFYGYLEFANRIRDIYDDKCMIEYKNTIIKLPVSKLKSVNKDQQIDVGVLVKWKENKTERQGKIVDIKKMTHKFKEICNQKYSNRVLIIDEAHNIRGVGDEKSDDNIKYIKLLVENTKNLKLILLSATPMYNKAEEIVEIMSLLYANDKRDSSIFNNIFKDEILVDGETLSRGVKGYISRIKGGSRDKFPDKLYPTENIKKIGNLPLYNIDMGNIQDKIYDEIYKFLNMKNLKDVSKQKILTQCSNIVYPSTKIEKKFGIRGLQEICKWNKTKNKYEYNKNVPKIFEYDNIGKYSCKIKKLIDNIKKSEGIIFIYSQYLGSGILPIILALEQNGYKNYNQNIFDVDSSTDGKYITLVGQNEYNINTNNQKEIDISTSYENRNGEKIKIILGSNVAAEGLDLKNIRSIHIIDPWYHLKKVEQIIGRGIRYCSHKDLLKDQKNVTVYLYCASNKKVENSVDLNIYNIAYKKNLEIQKVEKILSDSSIDKNIFSDINDLKPIKKNEHKYTIKKNMNSLNKNKLMNMYNVYEVYIKKYYENMISGNIDDISKYIYEKYETKNINIELLYLTLKYIVKYKRIVYYNEIKGNLILTSNNYIFQPFEIRDKNINVYERNNNNMEDKYIKLTIKKKNTDKKKSINIEDVIMKIKTNKDKYISTKYKIITEIKDYEKVIYDICFERLEHDEKRILIENMLSDKLDSELNKKVYEHFKSSLIDINFELDSDIKQKIGYVLFYFNKKTNTKKSTLNTQSPEFYFINDLGIYEISGTKRDKCIQKIKKKEIVFPEYYGYNFVSIKKPPFVNIINIYNNKNKKYNAIMCPTSNQKPNNIDDFIKIYPKIYEKYNYILNKPKISRDVFCIIIEIILRLESNEKIKYQYNYDEYMITDNYLR
jgi:hypothetical protein